MRASAFAALGLAAYSVFLVATIPAAYVASQVHAAFPRAVRIADPEGTLWHGSARVFIAPGRGAPAIDRLEWRFLPARLAAGELAFAAHAKAEGITATAQLARAFSQAHVRDLKVEGDAAALAGFVPVLAPWRPSGPVVVTAPGLTIHGRDVKGTLEAQWRDAASGLSEVRPLGSYRASWRGESTPGALSVTTIQGPLRIVGAGTTTAPFRIAFSGEARGEGERAKALEPLLDLMGPRRPDGSRALELRLE